MDESQLKPQPYSLCFKDCVEQANQIESRKIRVIIVDVICHEFRNGNITILFNDRISCQMAKDILGNDWHFTSEVQIYGSFINSLYEIQSHYFKSLSLLVINEDE